MIRRDRFTLPLLLLLTLVGGALRFASLDRPTIWGDEAATYGRVAGRYQDLLDQLSDSSFPPLHYEALWWLGQGMPYWGKVVDRDPPQKIDGDDLQTIVPTKFIVPGGIRLTPFYIRLIPAIAGTLFIPAIFFLTRQLLGPRVSLLAAGLASVNAYLLVYSRDAKMYMPFWLMCVLNVGCLLWWLRVRRPLPWLLWIASGIAMIGWHASGFMLLAIDAVIFFTSPRLHWRKLISLAGLLFSAALLVPALVYERVAMRYEWRGQSLRQNLWHSMRRTWAAFAMPAIFPFALGLLVMLSSMFGPRGFYSSFDGVYKRVSEDSRPAVDTGSLGIDWVPRYNAGRDLPGYLLYTTSAYLTGWEWPRVIDQPMIYPRTLRLMQAATIAILLLLATGLVPWRKAFRRTRARLDRIRQERCIAPGIRRRRVLWLAIWLTAIPWIVYTQSTAHPGNVLDAFAGLVLKNPPAPAWPRARLVADPKPPQGEAEASDNGNVFGAGIRAGIEASWRIFRESAADVITRWPAEWKVYAGAFQSANFSWVKIVIVSALLAAVLTLTIFKLRSIGRGGLELLAVVLALLVLGAPLVLLPRWLDNDVWMPRYLGVVLPAVLIFVAVLIARQPTRWAAGLTLGLFAAVNLGQFGARVYGHSEPPTDWMAADLIAAQPQSVVARNPEVNRLRFYTDITPNVGPEPGGTSLFNAGGRYYLHLLSGFSDHAADVRRGGFEWNLKQNWRASKPDEIVRDLKQSPEVDAVVVWSMVPAFEIDQTDAVGRALAGQFRRISDETWPAADHWRWVQHPQFRRRAYVRVPQSPATQASGTQPRAPQLR